MGSLRSVSGVIGSVVGLVILYFLGGIMFYRVTDAIDESALSPQWAIIFNALRDFFDLSLSIYIFLLIICIIVPLLWIFMGDREDTRGNRL